MAAIVQQIDGGGVGDPVTVSISPANGNFLVWLFKSANTVAINGVTAGSNTLTLRHSRVITADSGQTISAYVSGAITGSPTSASIDLASSTGVTGRLFEVSGLDATTQLDTTFDANGSGTAISAGFTTGVANAFVIGQMYINVGPTVTPGTGYTMTLTNGEWDRQIYDEDIGAAGAKVCDATLGTSRDWTLAGVALRPAASGGSGTILIIPRRRITVRRRLTN